jgi:hypothetical protein
MLYYYIRARLSNDCAFLLNPIYKMWICLAAVAKAQNKTPVIRRKA